MDIDRYLIENIDIVGIVLVMLEKILWYLEVARNPRCVLVQSYYDESIIHQTLRSFIVVIKAKIRRITDMHKEAWEENLYFIFQRCRNKMTLRVIMTFMIWIHIILIMPATIKAWLYVRRKLFKSKWTLNIQLYKYVLGKSFIQIMILLPLYQFYSSGNIQKVFKKWFI